MTRGTADQGRHRARIATWTLIAGGVAGAAAVAGVAAASIPPTTSGTPSKPHPTVGHSDDQPNPRDDATPQRRHHGIALSTPSSSQPSATSSGS